MGVNKINKQYINLLLYKGSSATYKSSIEIKISAKDAFLQTERELERLNGLIRKKKISNEHIGNSIFEKLRGEINDSDLKIYAFDHFTAGYYSFISVKDLMIKEKCFDYRGIKKYGYIINTILHDIREFANYIGKKKDFKYNFFEGWKSNIENSLWHYLGTKQLLYNSIYEKKVLDNKFTFILSSVSLRQTIELKMQRIMGVADYFDLNGQKVFVHHYFFFDFILKNKSHFDLTFIDIKII